MRQKGILFFLCMVAMAEGSAQIENIPISEDVKIDRLFVGVLTNTQLFFDEGRHNSLSTVQLGARAGIWIIPEKLRIRSFGAIKLINGSDTKSFSSFEAILTPHNRLEFQIGVMTTPTTELRPNPTTWQSQVETNAESTVIGGRPGARIQYTIIKGFNITYGFHDHGTGFGHHLKIKKGNLAFSTYVEKDQLFAGLKWSNGNYDFVGTRLNHVTAASAIIPIIRQLKTYIDIEYEEKDGSIKFGEFGFRSHFEKKDFLRGFFSIAYNLTSNNLQGGLYLHI